MSSPGFHGNPREEHRPSETYLISGCWPLSLSLHDAVSLTSSRAKAGGLQRPSGRDTEALKSECLACYSWYSQGWGLAPCSTFYHLPAWNGPQRFWTHALRLVRSWCFSSHWKWSRVIESKSWGNGRLNLVHVFMKSPQSICPFPKLKLPSAHPSQHLFFHYVREK